LRRRRARGGQSEDQHAHALARHRWTERPMVWRK
jgi:hypothetical protein